MMMNILRDMAAARPYQTSTPKQVTVFNIILGRFLGKADRVTRLAVASELFGRPLSSTKELTAGEIQEFINMVNSPATRDEFVRVLQDLVDAKTR